MACFSQNMPPGTASATSKIRSSAAPDNTFNQGLNLFREIVRPSSIIFLNLAGHFQGPTIMPIVSSHESQTGIPLHSFVLRRLTSRPVPLMLVGSCLGVFQDRQGSVSL